MFGVIKEIDPSKFICDGVMYLNEDLTEKNDESVNIQSLIMKTSFDFKINKIISDAMNEDVNKSMNYRNSEIVDFFEGKRGNILDLIFFPDNGFRGLDKINLNENSIFYVKISENLKMGFFINKVMAEYILEGANVDKN